MTGLNEISVPMVSQKTRAESTNIETIIGRLRSKRLIIPDYQRDAEQWDLRKESLFIESLLNNLTIPAFFFAESDNGSIEVVDGQQRLATTLKYANDGFAISNDDGVVYLSPQSIQYVGKTFSQLSPKLQNVFNDYPLTIISLPSDLEFGTKLEIFRRINEGGTPLTAQDIRLSYYSQSSSVYLIRLAGVHSESASAERMIEAASAKGVSNPWDNNPQGYKTWKEWWSGKALARGQTPSEMFLWYLVMRHRNDLDNLLLNSGMMKHLPLSFRGTTEEALDIYCAQLRYTDLQGGIQIFPTLNHGLEDEFKYFAGWMHTLLNYGLPGISVDKYKQTALLIGAAIDCKLEPNDLSQDTWDAISEFIRTPRKSGEKWLKQEGGYPEQKGKWSGTKGQKAQCDAAKDILSKIVLSSS
jgi:Protein of unknown function DUF262